MKAFQIVVGNVGQVYDGSNYMQASCLYQRYVKQSKNPLSTSRVKGQPVTLFHNGEIKSEYLGTIEQQA